MSPNPKFPSLLQLVDRKCHIHLNFYSDKIIHNLIVPNIMRVDYTKLNRVKKFIFELTPLYINLPFSAHTDRTKYKPLVVNIILKYS